jgi:hypothetical protein
MNHDAARNKCLVFNLDVPCHQRAARDDRVVPNDAIMRYVAGGHDVVSIADAQPAALPRENSSPADRKYRMARVPKIKHDPPGGAFVRGGRSISGASSLICFPDGMETVQAVRAPLICEWLSKCSPDSRGEVEMLLLLIILLLVFGGGGGYYGYHQWGAGGGLGIVLLVLLVLFLFGRGRLSV